jgi:uroporphyrinogen decarboxylase
MCLDFVVRYDLIALERVKAQPVPLVFHLHGKNVYFETANRYPAHAVSWHNHETPPSLEEALVLTDRALMTSLDVNLLEHGQPEEVVAQAREAIERTGGQRLILAPACVISPATPAENLEAIANFDRSAL